jgi:RNA polymerase sigma factor (TIGR02999 family)
MSMATSEEERPDEPRPAADLLPAVYDELRRLAAALTQHLRPGQTLQATALVHEAYLRLVGDQDPGWQGRRHFFGAAARAMRQILIEQARRKGSRKHGGRGRRIELAEGMAFIEPPADDLLALDEAIQKLQVHQPRLAEIVMLRYYTGLSVEETAGVLGESVRTVYRDWRHARTWLALELGEDSAAGTGDDG